MNVHLLTSFLIPGINLTHFTTTQVVTLSQIQISLNKIDYKFYQLSAISIQIDYFTLE